MRIAVVDGQGGGMGKAIVEKLRGVMGQEIEVIALGTNALATAAMMKAGADAGATGENAICVTIKRVDAVVGTVGIISANSMLGELTPVMARAIAESRAKKILIPLNRCNLHIVGTRNEPLPGYLEEMAALVREMVQK